VLGEARFTIKHSYDNRGHLQQIKDVTAGTVPLWSVDARNDEGALTLGTYGNGVKTVRTYDPVSGRLKTLDQTDGGLLSSLKYDYYADGRVKQLQRIESAGSRSESYVYDSLNRLQLWTLNAGSVTKTTEYQHDVLGNLTRVLVGGLEQERNEYVDPRPHAVSENLDSCRGDQGVVASPDRACLPSSRACRAPSNHETREKRGFDSKRCGLGRVLRGVGVDLLRTLRCRPQRTGQDQVGAGATARTCGRDDHRGAPLLFRNNGLSEGVESSSHRQSRS
jgi:YD repeat-containing protein